MAVNKKVEVLKHLADLGTNKNGWTKEVNVVSWGGNEPKYDIREWDPDHERMGKGATFTQEQFVALKDYLKSDNTDLKDFNI